MGILIIAQNDTHHVQKSESQHIIVTIFIMLNHSENLVKIIETFGSGI